MRNVIRSFALVAWVILGAMLVPARDAGAVVLYAVQQGNANLVTVDSTTGVVSNVGLLPAGSNPSDSVQGLTGAGSTLLYTDGNGLPGVHELDPANAALIQSFALAGVNNRGGLSFDSGANALYTVNDGSPIARQSGLGGAVNLAFAAINPLFPGAIGGDDQGRHFAQGNVIGAGNAIYEFDPASGAVLNSLPLPAGQVPTGLAYDGTFLYASAIQSSTLFTLDPNSGAIVSSVSVNGAPLTALAYVSVPEPTTLLLLGLALAALAGASRRRG